MLFTLAMVLLALWLVLGLFHVAGSLVHILLALAMISLAWHLMERRHKNV